MEASEIAQLFVDNGFSVKRRPALVVDRSAEPTIMRLDGEDVVTLELTRGPQRATLVLDLTADEPAAFIVGTDESFAQTICDVYAKAQA